MNSTGAALMANPHPCGHLVYPYTDDAQLADAIAFFAGAGLKNAEAVVLVMTAEHAGPVRKRLREEGFRVEDLERSGQLVCKDAKDLLSYFLPRYRLDEYLFKVTLSTILEKAKAYSGNRERPVRVFGEMVDLLWRSDVATTRRLEELWNEVILRHRVPLLCAYSLKGIEAGVLPAELIACHSSAIA